LSYRRFASSDWLSYAGVNTGGKGKKKKQDV
jgi:hypothetical protein